MYRQKKIAIVDADARAIKTSAGVSLHRRKKNENFLFLAHTLRLLLLHTFPSENGSDADTSPKETSPASLVYCECPCVSVSACMRLCL